LCVELFLPTNPISFSFPQIDFQFSHVGSPALDLIHLLYTSLSDELYNQDYCETFVQTYYIDLKNMLSKLGYDFANFLTLQEFQIEVFRKSFYGGLRFNLLQSAMLIKTGPFILAFVYTMTVYPLMTSDDKDNDFIAHHSEDERATNFKRRMVKAEKYQRVVKKMLPIYDQMGLLDMHEINHSECL
jgi:Ecdysteroid kinase-like family